MILECINQRWDLKFGDPNFIGWTITFGYLTASFLAFRLSSFSKIVFPPNVRKIQNLFWKMLSACLLLLAINKQLDFQSLFIMTGKCISLADGWYDNRQVVRTVFTIGFGIAVVTGILAMVWLTKDVWRLNLIALIGVLLILTFIVLRAAIFMHFGGTDWSHNALVESLWLLEMIGIGMVIYSASTFSYKNQT